MIRNQFPSIVCVAVLGVSGLLCLKLFNLSGPDLWAAGFLSGYLACFAAEVVR